MDTNRSPSLTEYVHTPALNFAHPPGVLSAQAIVCVPIAVWFAKREERSEGGSSQLTTDNSDRRIGAMSLMSTSDGVSGWKVARAA